MRRGLGVKPVGVVFAKSPTMSVIEQVAFIQSPKAAEVGATQSPQNQLIESQSGSQVIDVEKVSQVPPEKRILDSLKDAFARMSYK